MSGYYAYGNGFEEQLYAKQGNVALAEATAPLLSRKFASGPIRNALHAFLTDLAEVLAKADRFGESLGAASEALQRAERNDAFWWIRKRCVLLARV